VTDKGRWRTARSVEAKRLLKLSRGAVPVIRIFSALKLVIGLMSRDW